MDRVSLGQIYIKQSVTVADLQRTKWHWDRFIMERVELGQMYRGQISTGTDL